MIDETKSGERTHDAHRNPRFLRTDAGRLGPAVLPRSPAEQLEPHRAPKAPRSRRLPKERNSESRFGGLFRFVNGLMTLVLMTMIATGLGYYFIKGWFDAPGPLAHGKIFAIPPGEGVNATAERLEREGFISDRRVLTAAYYWFRFNRPREAKLPVMKAGEYEIKKAASMRDVLDALTEGKSILYRITVAEGMTSYQVVERLNANTELTGTIAEVPPEGSLQPDTYKFSRGMSRQDLIERMQAQQRNTLQALWEGRAQGLPVTTPQEALILASIVEKETGRSDERNRVAAVFVNRMRQRMRLQSDPTIVYGVTGGKGALGRGILRSEIEQKTPYNTYQIDGLPPTPICNPGRAAIEATLNPAKTDELYFVANGKGGHVFARTLAEHNKNVASWRKVERDMKEAAQPSAAATAVPAKGAQVLTVPGAASEQPAAQEQAAPALDVPRPVRKPRS
jgi:UPF0755 protein